MAVVNETRRKKKVSKKETLGLKKFSQHTYVESVTQIQWQITSNHFSSSYNAKSKSLKEQFCVTGHKLPSPTLLAFTVVFICFNECEKHNLQGIEQIKNHHPVKSHSNNDYSRSFFTKFYRNFLAFGSDGMNPTSIMEMKVCFCLLKNITLEFQICGTLFLFRNETLIKLAFCLPIPLHLKSDIALES